MSSRLRKRKAEKRTKEMLALDKYLRDECIDYMLSEWKRKTISEGVAQLLIMNAFRAGYREGARE